MSAEPPIFQEAPENGGATVTNTYLTRQVKVFAVSESEIEMLSTLNGQATAFFGVGAALVSLSFGILTNRIFVTDKVSLSPEANLAVDVGVPFFFVVSLVFFGLGGYASYRRRKMIKDIRNQSPDRVGK